MTSYITYDGPYSITDKGLILGQTDTIHKYYLYKEQIRFLNNGSIYVINLTDDTVVIKDNIMVITNCFGNICTRIYFETWMNNITTVIFDEDSEIEESCFNESFALIPSIVELRFGQYFDRPINLTRCLTTLVFGKNFNQLIVLPSSMISLTFGLYYDQPIILTPYITTLKFGRRFDHPIVFGPHLRILTLGSDFNQPILLNKCLCKITFGCSFNQRIVLSKHLHYVVFGFRFNQHVILTKNITHLAVRELRGICTELLNITDISIENNDYAIDNLSNNISHIKIGCNFTLPLGNVPNSAKNVKVHNLNYQYKSRFKKSN